MGDRTITLNVESPTPISFAPDDYVTFRTERFSLYYTPTAKKIAASGSRGDSFVYDLIFVPAAFELKKCAFLDFVASDNNLHYTGLPAVAFTGEVRMLVERIKANLDRLYTGGSAWTINVDTDASHKIQNISLSDSDCWNALMQANVAYGLYFSVRGRVITIGISGISHTAIFEYGKGSGLYELTRVARSSEPVVTRLKCYGANRNIPKGYKKGAGSVIPAAQYIPSLMLPDYETTGIDYLQSDNTSIYGIREGVFRDETIFPSIENMTGEMIRAAGMISITNGRVNTILWSEMIPEGSKQTEFSFEIPDIGFSILDWLSPETPAIEITSGRLGGVKLSIVQGGVRASDNGYMIMCSINNDSGFPLPDSNTYLQAGDTFVITGIYMPDVYVLVAEERLAVLGDADLADKDHSKFTYSLGVDEIFMVDNALKDTLYEGDRMHIQDADVGVDESIIAQQLSITFGGLLPKYEITLSDKPLNTALEQVRRGLVDVATDAATATSEVDRQARITELKENQLANTLLDPTTGKLKPNVTETDVNALLQAENDVSSGLLDGYILWKIGLTYHATDINYKIMGEKYMSHAQDITLDDADPTFARIDIFFVDTFGNLAISKGTPSATPVAPTLIGTQLQVLSVTIEAGATTPAGLDVDWVYLENTSPDWATTSVVDSNVSVNFASTDAPATGSKRIKVSINVPTTIQSKPLHKIGDEYQGGIIFWLNPEKHLSPAGSYGYIAAKFDTSPPIFWSRISGGAPYETGAGGFEIGTGRENTDLILLNERAKDLAVKSCKDCRDGGYSDWYMPSLYELREMWFRRMEIGNLLNKTYWSSSEVDWNHAGCFTFAEGWGVDRLKNNNYYVRAIRSFNDSTIPTGITVPSAGLNTTELTFTSPEPVSVKDGALSFNMKSSILWKDSSTIIITSVLGSTNTGVVAIKPKYLMGYNPNDPAWQQVVIPMYKFAGNTRATIDKFRINFKFEWPNGIDIGLDDIRFQHTIVENIIIKERLDVTDYRFGELPDSERTVFTTLTPYIAGTVRLRINGKEQNKGVDFFEENSRIRIGRVLDEDDGFVVNYYSWKA